MTATDLAAASGLGIRDLTVRIPLRPGAVVHAVSEVSLDLAPGTVTALVGESGCGKSMVGAAVLGMLPAHAQVRGTVTLGSIDVLDAVEAVRGRRIGLVPQSPATHFTPVRTVGAQLAETIHAVGSRYSCAELAARADFPVSALTRYPHELSGGMAQRAAIAAALAGDPEVIVADEPTSGLDRARTDRTLLLLRRCAADGAAVLLITHDLGALLRTGVADRLAVMYASHLLEVGPAADVLDDPWHAYTRDLLAALPARGMHPLPHPPPVLTNLTVDRPYLGPGTLIPKGSRMIRERAH
ncbi:ATP-binding cassette domain-containing protein [Nocardia sp. NPDC048505]|uniref:ATP-binding cassette domain-containing protein n=1 Tax=unclassified Nocardia TaxID=2637762 RepID=UPI0033F1BF9D